MRLLTNLLLITLLLYGFTGALAQEPVKASKNQLNTLNKKIKLLHGSLTRIQDKKQLLNKELAGIEKQISEQMNHLDALQQKIKTNEEIHALLQKKIDALNDKINQQQQLLAAHVKVRYQMGSYQPLKWLLNQEDPYKISRLFTYYQYLIQSHQQVLTQLDTLRKDQLQAQYELAQEVRQNKKLQDELHDSQYQLQQQKIYQIALVGALEKQIHTHEKRLSDYKENKKNLTRLLAALIAEKPVPPSVPFSKMYKKLPFPVQAQQKFIQKRYQGLTFFAEEGTAVTAVYPGTVVFSDWLKGYGLLLIIDHGQGYMTLYAHNQSLLKHQGQTVKQNELIARIGHSGGLQQNGLYFEIRQYGKAISSHRWFA